MTNLAKLLTENVNGATFISISTETDPRLKGGKANPFVGHTVKVMTGANVMVFQNKRINGYDAMVKRRLEKEGKSSESFKLSPRTWGHRVPNMPFVEHKGNYYLEVIFLKSGDVHYEVDGVELDKKFIQGLPEEKEEAHQGGLNDKVIIRTFKIDSIKSITVNHETYEDGLYFDLNEIQ